MHNLGNNNNKLAKTWKYQKIQDKFECEVDSFSNSPLDFHKNFDWINRETASLYLLIIMSCMLLRQDLTALFDDVDLGCLLTLFESE